MTDADETTRSPRNEVLRQALRKADPEQVVTRFAALLEEVDPDRADAIVEELSRGGPGLVTSPPRTRLAVGDAIGPYRIVRMLGEGGMGIVYLARRDDDLEMCVAIKTMSHWTPMQERQFHNECKTLAGLQHPGIAHLIDAGTTVHGQPWMALEYVPGKPLDVWLREERPGLEQRLDVFLQICDALTHAHGQMVIHRDLKPNNVIVTPEGRPKLLDFGIASLLDPETGQQLLATIYATDRLTPEYASPEQFNGERLTVASDVYSMGVLLFEMLTGTRPHASSQQTTTTDLVRKVCQGPLTRPSKMPPPPEFLPFERCPSGDLDVVALKALAPEPALRYASVEALGRDIRLYLEGMPIQAKPATSLYRLRKFVGRNPWPVALAASLLFFLSAFSIFAVRQREVIRLERDHARHEQRAAQSVTGFMIDLFEQVDPDEARGAEISALEVLDAGRDRIEVTLSEDPEVQGQILFAMGRVYRSLGKYGTSRELLEKALERGELSQEDRVEKLRTLVEILQLDGKLDVADRRLDELEDLLGENISSGSVARVQHVKGRQAMFRGQFARADRAFEAAMDGNALDDRERLALLHDRIQLFHEWGYSDRAIDLQQQVLAEQRTLFGEPHSKVAQSLQILAKIHMAQGDYAKAEAQLEAANVMLHQLYDDDHPRIGYLLDSRAYCSDLQGRYGPAETDYRRALEIKAASLGKDHPQYASTLNNLALLLFHQHKLDDAERLYRESLNIQRKSLGEGHPRYANVLHNLGAVLKEKGDLDSAETLYREAMAIRRETLGEHHEHFVSSLNNLGNLLKKRGDLKAAEALFRKALAIRRQTLGVNHPNYAICLNNLAGLLRAKGDLQGPEPLLREAIAIRRKSLGDLHPRLAVSLANLGSLLDAREEFESAEPLLREALAISEKTVGKQHPSYARCLDKLAFCLKSQQKWPETEALYRELMELRAKVGKENLKFADALAGLAITLKNQDQLKEAEEAYLKVLALRLKLGEKPLRIAGTYFNIGALYKKKGNWALADQFYRQAQTDYEKILSPHHSKVGQALLMQADVSCFRGDPEVAAQLLDQARAIFEQEPPENRVTQYVMSSIQGAVEAGLGRWDEGATNMRAALKALLESEGPRSPVTEAARARMAHAFQVAGRSLEEDQFLSLK